MLRDAKSITPRAFPLAYQIHQLSLRLASQGRAIIGRHSDLTLPQWRVIRMIGLDPTKGSTALRNAVGFDKGQFSKTTAALTDEGYIEIRPHPTDKRQFVPVLTAKGRAVLELLEPELDRRQAHLMSALTAEEQRLIGPILEKLFAAAAFVDIPEHDGKGPPTEP